MANFLTYPGTAGFLVTPVTLVSSEIISLGSSVTATGGTVLTQASFANAIYGIPYLTVGTSFTPVAGGNIAGWWLFSADGGSSYEIGVSSVAPQPRPPDWIIPLSTAGANATAVYPGPLCRLPWWTTKAYVQNNTGVTLSTTNSGTPSIKIAPVAIQY